MDIKTTKTPIITCINEKGGIGKSSICFNVAWCLAAERNKRVLMIDLDGQRANLTFFSGIEKNGDMCTLYDILVNEVDVKHAVLQVCDNLHILPATQDVASLDNHNTKADALRPVIEPILPYYDYVFIDVSPTPNITHALAMGAADHVIIPMLPDVTSLEGDLGVIESIQMARKTVNPNLNVLGIVLNRYVQRPLLTFQVETTAESIAAAVNSKVFKTKIRSTVKLSENIGQSIGITSYAPKSGAAEDYRNLTDEIIKEVNA